MAGRARAIHQGYFVEYRSTPTPFRSRPRSLFATGLGLLGQLDAAQAPRSPVKV
jgi:hypothetical protein